MAVDNDPDRLRREFLPEGLLVGGADRRMALHEPPPAVLAMHDDGSTGSGPRSCRVCGARLDPLPSQRLLSIAAGGLHRRARSLPSPPAGLGAPRPPCHRRSTTHAGRCRSRRGRPPQRADRQPRRYRPSHSSEIRSVRSSTSVDRSMSFHVPLPSMVVVIRIKQVNFAQRW